MAAVSINIGQIIQEIRSIAVDIRDTQKAEKESRKAAQLLVYKALAIHPALEYMRPPTGVLGDVDWYTELRSSFNKGIFRRLGPSSGQESRTVGSFTPRLASRPERALQTDFGARGDGHEGQGHDASAVDSRA